MLLVCFPLKRYDDLGEVDTMFHWQRWRRVEPVNHCTRKIYAIVKKGIKEWNRQSNNSCYFYVVRINEAYKRSYNWNARKIEITIGLTTIKKNKLPEKCVIFPSLFEADKSLREDIVISYTKPQSDPWRTTIREDLHFEDPPSERKHGKYRMKYLATCEMLNYQSDYEFYFLIKGHFCPLCLINHAKVLF